MKPLSGKSAVVTGASQGIGQAIAAALYASGVQLVLIGRDRQRLESSVAALPEPTELCAPPLLVQADLLDTTSLNAASEQILSTLSTVDILVNCGGAYERGRWEDIDPTTFSELTMANVIGPVTLTRSLLPKLVESRGDVVFVNSSITRSPGPGAGVFKSTQHALQAMTDSLRAEFNEQGIRVLSIYPGRTATPRQEGIFADEGARYVPERLLQSSDVAGAVLFCLSLPQNAEVTDLYIRPRIKG